MMSNSADEYRFILRDFFMGIMDLFVERFSTGICLQRLLNGI